MGEEEWVGGLGRSQADCMFVNDSGHPQIFLCLICKETGEINFKKIYVLMTTNYIEG